MPLQAPKLPPITPTKEMGKEVPNPELDKRIISPIPDVLKTSKDPEPKFTDLPVNGVRR